LPLVAEEIIKSEYKLLRFYEITIIRLLNIARCSAL